MTDTPRTDKVWREQNFDSHISCINAANALVKHARSIERELEAAKEEIRDLKALFVEEP